jgi:prolyl-tRNA synthetase
MFGILFDTEDMKRETPCQTSFGLTTRSIGVMVLTHMDEKGVVLPPKVAPIQIIVIPIYNKKVDTNELLKYTNNVVEALQNMNLRVELDDRKEYTPGWKYNYYEGLGIPLRVEVGMNDLKNSTFRVAKRYNMQKEDIDFASVGTISSILDQIQQDMFRIAKVKLDEKIIECKNFSDFEVQIREGKMVITPWLETSESEEKIKSIMKEQGENIKTLCKPYHLNTQECTELCFFTGEKANCYVMWGKSY